VNGEEKRIVAGGISVPRKDRRRLVAAPVLAMWFYEAADDQLILQWRRLKLGSAWWEAALG
jgi:hypothetical protein